MNSLTFELGERYVDHLKITPKQKAELKVLLFEIYWAGYEELSKEYPNHAVL